MADDEVAAEVEVRNSARTSWPTRDLPRPADIPWHAHPGDCGVGTGGEWNGLGGHHTVLARQSLQAHYDAVTFC